MKRVIIISLILFGLGFVSCQKEQIVPIQSQSEVPVWEDGYRAPGDGSEIDDSDNGGIVDPDDEEDGSDKPNPTGKPAGN